MTLESVKILRALSRRSFFGGAVAAAGSGVLLLVTRGSGASSLGASATVAPDPLVSAFSDPFVAYVRDPLHGEIAFMVGTREIVRRDPELVARLLKLAR